MSAEEDVQYYRDWAAASEPQNEADSQSPGSFCEPSLIENFGPPAFSTKKQLAQINEPFWAGYFLVRQPETIYEPNEKKFYSYVEETGLFSVISEAVIQKILAEQILDASRRWVGFEGLSKFRNERFLRGVISHLKSQTEKMNAFLPFGNIVHLANCVLEFDQQGTFTKHPFSAKYRSRYRSPIAYDPQASYCRFEQTLLSHLQPDDWEILQKYAGQCLLGRNLTQTILILDGVAGASKGAVVLVIKGITGETNAYQLRTQLLDKQFEIGRMTGKTLLLGADVKSDFLSKESASVLKALVGGDTLEGERKRSNDGNSMSGVFNVIVTANSRLKVKLEGDESAWERRLIIVSYPTPFTGKRIPEIDKILLHEEGPGILNWCLAGLMKLLKDIAGDTGTVRLSDRQHKKVHSLLRESDSLRIFVQSNVVKVSTDENLTVEEIVTAYIQYCLDCEWVPVSSRKAESELPDLMLEFFGQARSGSIQRNGTAKRGFRKVRFRREDEADPGSN
jgi:putative DNA primase/helicase